LPFRQDAGDHAHIDEGVGEKRQGDRAGHQAAKQCGGFGGDHQATANHQQVERQQDQVAKQAKFFGVHGKDKVSGALGDEFQVGLRAAEPALAGGAAGADGDHRLDDVVAGAQRVGAGVDQGEYALALVIVHHVPHKRQAGAKRHRAGDHHFPRQAGEEQHKKPRGHDQRGGAQVGLLEDEQRGDDDDHRAHQIMVPAQGVFVLLEVPGQHHRHHDFQHFRGLDAGDAHMQPAPRAIDHFAKQRHAQQHQHADNIAGHGQLHQGLRADIGHAPHDAQRHQHEGHLVDDFVQILVGRRKQHHQAERKQRHDQRQQPAVDGRAQPLPGTAQQVIVVHSTTSSAGAAAGLFLSARTCCALGASLLGALTSPLRPVR
jgi:hypothetical protein